MEVKPPPDQRLSWYLLRRMMSGGLALLPLAALTLLAGMWIYRYVEGLDWSDSFLNAAMLLAGMGPIDALKTTTGKWLAGFYALFAGLVFIALVGAMLAPVVHHVLERLHMEQDDDGGAR